MLQVLSHHPAGASIARVPDGLLDRAPVADPSVPGTPPEVFPVDQLAGTVLEAERHGGRWVWEDTEMWYPDLLRSGVRVERCVDLRLTHAILRNSALSARSGLATGPRDSWDAPPTTESEETFRPEPALFDLESAGQDGSGVEHSAGRASGDRASEERALAELDRQRQALRTADQPHRLRLLLAAESAGALIAAEMRHVGLPWRSDVHDAILTELLGPRPSPGGRPARLTALSARIRAELSDERLNPDSPAEVLRALRRAGVNAGSTRSWELKDIDHPAIAPLLEYKKLSRLLTANGWSWVDSWVRDGRFHPDYVPAGVVSGRWATRGGGALQLPRQLRSAVVADEGWRLVVADAAQLEPRILAGLAGDEAMAAAGRDADLYQGIVDSGAVESRAQAKVAMLGAMYGSTTGESAILMPRMARAYPRAIRYVEEAARAGERGDIVTSRLGRSSPPPGGSWSEVQGRASSAEATAEDERRARSQARDWGRFTRNFVVQATAAEWALCWMAEVRRLLGAAGGGRARSRLEEDAHLVYFLHDEIIVHAPEEKAEEVRDIIVASARTAGRLLFGDFPVEFPVSASIVRDYGEAKG